MNFPPTVRADIQARLEAQSAWTEEVEQVAAGRRILSTLPYRKVDFWTRAVHTLDAKRPPWNRFPARFGLIGHCLHLLTQARHFELVLLTGGERSDLMYAALAGLCFWVRTPHVIVDAHWQRAEGIGHLLQRLLLRLARRAVRQVQVHSEEEVPLYNELFGVPLEQLRAIPWSTSLIGFPDNPAAGFEADEPEPFVLTGGHSFRDYGLFLAAAVQSGLRVKLGLPPAGVTPEILRCVKENPRISLHTDWSNAEYVKQMALCRVFAMPITQGLTRATADQTILNAMYFGKLVVSTDSIGPRIYLRDGENGILVRQPSVAAWAEALTRAFSLAESEEQRITLQAAYDARVRFNEHLRLARTLDVALRVIEPQRQPVSRRMG